jgi:hypothetical protein
MKNIFIILLGLVLLSVVGCSSTTLIETQYRDGKYQRKHYSKYYDDGSYLVGKDIAVIACVDHVRKNIPILYDLQRWLGALGPSDMDAKGLVTLYFWNLGEKNYSLDVVSVSNGNSPEHTLSGFDGHISVPAGTPKTKYGIVPGTLPIDHYGKEVHLTVVIKSGENTMTNQFIAQRRTFEELEQFFGPNVGKGVSPIF